MDSVPFFLSYAGNVERMLVSYLAENYNVNSMDNSSFL